MSGLCDAYQLPSLISMERVDALELYVAKLTHATGVTAAGERAPDSLDGVTSGMFKSRGWPGRLLCISDMATLLLDLILIVFACVLSFPVLTLWQRFFFPKRS